MNAVTGVVGHAVLPLPFDEPGTVALLVNDNDYELLTRDADTDVCFDGETVRGSDLLARLADAEGPVSVILWLRDGLPAVTAKFTTGDQ